MGKYIVFLRESYKKPNGICDVRVDKVTVKDVTKENELIKADVSVDYSYAYGSDKVNRCRAFTQIKVTVLEKNGKYVVKDMDSSHYDTDVRMVKEAVKGEKNFDGVDSYFENLANNSILN